MNRNHIVNRNHNVVKEYRINKARVLSTCSLVEFLNSELHSLPTVPLISLVIRADIIMFLMPSSAIDFNSDL